VSSSAGKIRAITFDVGHTLIEPREAVGDVYAEAAARHGGTNLSRAELEHRFQIALGKAGSAVNTREDWARIVDDTFAGLVAPPPSETFFPELFERFAQPSAWRIYDDVWPALDELSHRRVRLGVISNWDNRLRALLAALELASRFEVIVISCEQGCAKPARAMFKSAARQFRLPPAEILHVGDNWEADVQGARAAGFHSIQIARGSPASPDRATTLRALASFVESDPPISPGDA
jgi:putative hydrolase of the HAD superfamily